MPVSSAKPYIEVDLFHICFRLINNRQTRQPISRLLSPPSSNWNSQWNADSTRESPETGPMTSSQPRRRQCKSAALRRLGCDVISATAAAIEAIFHPSSNGLSPILPRAVSLLSGIRTGSRKSNNFQEPRTSPGLKISRADRYGTDCRDRSGGQNDEMCLE